MSSRARAPEEMPPAQACGALVLWADDQPGYRSAGRALAGLLSEEPHRLQSELADLPAALGLPASCLVPRGLAADQLSSALFQLSLVAERATVLFDIARAEPAAELLRSRAQLYDIQAQMFGKVEQGPELWGAASLVLARPFAYVEQRALSLRLPLVCLPQDEQERQTARVYAERGIGASVEQMASLAAQLEGLLGGRGAERAAAALSRISRRSATSEIARVVAQVAASAESILAEGRRDAPPVSDAAARRASPLQPIGQPCGQPQGRSGRAGRRRAGAELPALRGRAGAGGAQAQAIGGSMSVLVEFSMSPLDKGESVGDQVAVILEVIDASGLPYRLGPMGTCLEGEWAEVFAVIERCYERMRQDCRRISCSIKVDARQGAGGRLTSKVERLERTVGRKLST